MKLNHLLNRYHFFIDGLEIVAERKPVKIAKLQVMPDTAEVKLVVPLNVSRDWAESFIRQNLDWIHSARQQVFDQPPLCQLVDGDPVFYLGEALRLEVHDLLLGLPWVEVQPEQGLMRLYINKETSTRADRLAAIQKFYVDRLDRVARPYFQTWQAALGLNGVTWQVKLLKRYVTTRTPSKLRVTLNANLILLPPLLLEYIILFELVAIKHHLTGLDLEETLNALMPDWRTRKQLLDEAPLAQPLDPA